VARMDGSRQSPRHLSPPRIPNHHSRAPETAKPCHQVHPCGVFAPRLPLRSLLRNSTKIFNTLPGILHLLSRVRSCLKRIYHRSCCRLDCLQSRRRNLPIDLDIPTMRIWLAAIHPLPQVTRGAIQTQKQTKRSPCQRRRRYSEV